MRSPLIVRESLDNLVRICSYLVGFWERASREGEPEEERDKTAAPRPGKPTGSRWVGWGKAMGLKETDT